MIEIIPIESLGEIKENDNILNLIAAVDVNFQDHDILVIASKILAKRDRHIFKRENIQCTVAERKLADKLGVERQRITILNKLKHKILAVIPMRDFVLNIAKDSPYVTAGQMVKMACPVIVTRDCGGTIHTSDGGIDCSNHEKGIYSYVPSHMDIEAQWLVAEIEFKYQVSVPVIISDTELFPQGGGTMDLAVGSHGISPVANNFGKLDRNGRPKFGGTDSTVHILAGIAGLVMGQADESIPAVIIRGVEFEWDSKNGVNSSAPKFSRKFLKETLRLTAETKPLATRLLLKGISCLM